MAIGVNLYELMHRFWEENDYDPIPASATAMFFFLLDRANSRHWKMPVRCPTTQISRALMVSEQTVLNSRDTLFKRGMISFTKGHGNSAAPTYTIVTAPKDWAVRLGNHLADRLGDDLGDCLGDDLDIYKNKDIKSKKEIKSEAKNSQKNDVETEDLKDRVENLKSQEIWKFDIAKKHHLEPTDVPSLLDDFHLDMRCQMTSVRNVPALFDSWLYRKKQNQNENRQNYSTSQGSRSTGNCYSRPKRVSAGMEEPEYGLVDK